MKKICFVSGGFYQDHMGGAEIAIKQIADNFIETGWTVSFVAQGKCEEEVTTPKGEYVIYYRPHYKLVVENKHSIIHALQKADADVYYQRVTSFLTLVTANYCRQFNRLMIWASAHNEDCQPYRHTKDLFVAGKIRDYSLTGKLIKPVNNLITDWAYHAGIRRAHIRVVQSYEQQKLLKDSFNLESHVLYRGYPNLKSTVSVEKTDSQLILWVANLRHFKQPHIFVQFAKQLAKPNRRFVMVGSPFAVPETQKQFEQEVSQIEGLDYLGSLPHHEVINLMAQADLFVLTSRSEGFPTVIIEAWLQYTPVLSYGFDPDNLIVDHKVGDVTTDFAELVQLGEKWLQRIDPVPAKNFDNLLQLFDMKKHGDGLRQLIHQHGV